MNGPFKDRTLSSSFEPHRRLFVSLKMKVALTSHQGDELNEAHQSTNELILKRQPRTSSGLYRPRVANNGHAVRLRSATDSRNLTPKENVSASVVSAGYRCIHLTQHPRMNCCCSDVSFTTQRRMFNIINLTLKLYN
jgi:hypothetical protein